MSKLQRLIKERDKYKAELEKLKNEIKALKYENNLLRSNKIDKSHNERRAGRKERFSAQEKETMKMYRIQGKTIKEISVMYSCSIELVHKIVKE